VLAAAPDAVTASIAAALRSGAEGAGAVLGNCPLGGTIDASCNEQGGSSMVSSTLSNCSIAASRPGETVVSSGRLTTTVAAIGVCRTGVLPQNVRITTRFENFTAALRAADGTLIERLTGSFTQTIDPSGQGCAGVHGSLSIDGSLAVERPSARADIALVAGGLRFSLGSSGPEPCARELLTNGSMEVDDRATGRRFTSRFRDLRMLLVEEDNDAVTASFEGAMGVDCLGELELRTEEPLWLPNASDCPTAGLLVVLRADASEARVGFTAAGGLEIELDTGGVPERTEVSSCRESAQCS
jgi:hypothetical protein